MKAKSKKSKTKFYPIVFKLSARQRKSLRNYCKQYNTTPIKVIKANIQDEIGCYFAANNDNPEISPRQLQLFDDENKQQTIDFKE